MQPRFYHSEILPAGRSVFIRFMWISEQTAIFALSSIQQSVFTTEMASVHCADCM